MITRSFLFLLALLTGLSANEAASAAHSAPTSVGSSIAASSTPISGLVNAGRMKAIALIMAQPSRSVIGSSLIKHDFPDHQILISNRVFRGERSRE
jgi:hypothetical protein